MTVEMCDLVFVLDNGTHVPVGLTLEAALDQINYWAQWRSRILEGKTLPPQEDHHVFAVNYGGSNKPCIAVEARRVVAMFTRKWSPDPSERIAKVFEKDLRRRNRGEEWRGEGEED